MRIIAGEARGRRLIAPPGRDTRPTLDRVREALFSILMPRLAEARFLDLYAGSGANGIEALSRGAAAATFVESNRKSLGVIQENLEGTGLAEGGTCVQRTLPGELCDLKGVFDIIFADPPYAYSDYAGLLAGIYTCGLLDSGGVIILEHPRKVDVPAAAGDLCRTREAQYGGTALSFYS